MSFSGTQDKCKACDKTVHFIDLLTADGIPFHKTCFKCSRCKGTLSMCNYSSLGGILYCKPHFEQLLKETGSFTKEFPRAHSLILQLTVEGESYHKTCFKCSHGGCKLTPSSYAAFQGILYCKHHFAQLFKEKGSYNHLLKVASMKQSSGAVEAAERTQGQEQSQEKLLT
ncbi:hypothetical protein B296_00041164 [Ensete ventricosum]|uniref:LIM zinc-binding domain-containing protein n=1 Tax=Ensete ventricosum TaxID=4639 RepID=A0A426ZMY9_ENSVE|nr:hypothetical protein B296_00041164 [Ensete ventricosum]